jgi:hypothetical protein
MQFFLAQVEQGKNTVCGYLRASAVDLKITPYNVIVIIFKPVRSQEEP